MLARDGLLPYHDYPYFHMPNLVLANALLFRLTDYYLLATRTFSVIGDWLLLAAVSLTALRLFSDRPGHELLGIGAGIVLLLGTSPMMVYTSGHAWNHDVPTALCVRLFYPLSMD